MRVRELAASAYRVPLPRPWGPDVPCVHLLVTAVEASEGAAGGGFSWTPSIGARAVRALLAHECRAAVLGEPVAPEPVWDRLWWQLREAGGGGVTTLALAGVDIALWDLRARAADTGLVELLGRRRDHVPVYGSGVNLHYPAGELEEQARRWVRAGYPAVKVKVGKPDLGEDLERVSAVREIIGPDRLLMLDANQRWDLPTARRAARAFDRFDPYWLEEPLPADDLAAYAQLRAAVDVPVALGENLYTTYQFRDALARGCCDVVQPNVVRVGGITPFLRIAELARTHDVPVAPHLLPELSGQLALTLPLVSMVEDVEGASFDALGVLDGPGGVEVTPEGVRVRPGRPGHGLSFATGGMEVVDN